MRKREKNNNIVKLLNPVYNLHFNDDLQKAVEAVNSDNKNEIKESIGDLENLLKNTKRKDFSNNSQYTAWKLEVKVKTLILKAVLNDKKENWRDAGNSYQELSDFLFEMGGFLEKNASNHALELSRLCNL